MDAAWTPFWMTSLPRSAPTLRSSITVSLAGRAPARSSAESVPASWTVKLPEIWPDPPVMGSRITGALSTLPSRLLPKLRRMHIPPYPNSASYQP